MHVRSRTLRAVTTRLGKGFKYVAGCKQQPPSVDSLGRVAWAFAEWAPDLGFESYVTYGNPYVRPTVNVHGPCRAQTTTVALTLVQHTLFMFKASRKTRGSATLGRPAAPRPCAWPLLCMGSAWFWAVQAWSVLFHSAHPQMGPHPISRFVQLEGVQKGPLDRWYTSGLRRRPSQRALLGEKVLVVYTYGFPYISTEMWGSILGRGSILSPGTFIHMRVHTRRTGTEISGPVLMAWRPHGFLVRGTGPDISGTSPDNSG